MSRTRRHTPVNFRTVLRFHRWVQTRTHPLVAQSWRDVVAYWEVSRSTAYRYIRDYNDALGNP